MEQIKIGTLIEDMGKIGLVKRVIDQGALVHCHPAIKWRLNYEIYYSDGAVGYLGTASLQRMINSGCIEIIFTPEDV